MSFIISILGYGDVVKDNGFQILINQIEGVKVEAMRNVTGGTKLTLWTNYIAKMVGKNSPMYKMVNGIPRVFEYPGANARAKIHDHFPRQSHNLTELHTSTSFYSNCFLPSTIKMRNDHPVTTRDFRS